MDATSNIMSAMMRAGIRVRSLNAMKWERLIPVVLVVLGVLSWLLRMEGPLDLRWDGGTHYILGTAFAQGKGYRLCNEPGEIEAIQYPPPIAPDAAAQPRETPAAHRDET
jgi:hypothetical protein